MVKAQTSEFSPPIANYYYYYYYYYSSLLLHHHALGRRELGGVAFRVGDRYVLPLRNLLDSLTLK